MHVWSQTNGLQNVILWTNRKCLLVLAWVKIQLISLKQSLIGGKPLTQPMKAFEGPTHLTFPLWQQSETFRGRILPGNQNTVSLNMEQCWMTWWTMLEPWKFACPGEPAQSTEPEGQLGAWSLHFALHIMLSVPLHKLHQIRGQFLPTTGSLASVGTWNKCPPDWLAAVPFLADLCWVKPQVFIWARAWAGISDKIPGGWKADQLH